MELMRSNPGSTVTIHKEDYVEPPIFRRMYICLDASKTGSKLAAGRLSG